MLTGVRVVPKCIGSIPDTWSFNGNVERPTFTPSVKITGKQRITDGLANGNAAPTGKALDGCCHYILTDGVLNFCGDCTHALVGKSVPLPPLPQGVTDE